MDHVPKVSAVESSWKSFDLLHVSQVCIAQKVYSLEHYQETDTDRAERKLS